MNRGLLLDVDGVIFRDKAMHSRVANNICRFVQKTVNPYTPLVRVRKINELMYKNYGHTYIGLNKIYDNTIHLKEFNEAVYDEELIDALKRCNVDENAYNAKSIFDVCKSDGVPVYLFSNAPYIWCRTVMENYNIPLAEKYFLTPDSAVHDGELDIQRLKPTKECYQKVLKYLFDQHGYKTKWIMVDDQLTNLSNLTENTYVKSLLFCDEPSIYSRNISSIHTLLELHPMI